MTILGALRNLFGLKRNVDPTNNDQLWSTGWFASQTVSGIQVSQVTALSSSAVLACVSMLSEDVAKIKPVLYRRRADGGRDIVKDHWFAKLLKEPTGPRDAGGWMTGFEFRQFMMVQLILRENAFAVIIRDRSGRPIKLIPMNSDRVAIWEAPDGNLFYRVTPLGLHERAQLADEPFLIPAEDILHIRGLSLNGLLGSARIVLGKEAIGLALAYEQQAARWMSAGSKPSGVLLTDQKLTKDAAARIGGDWRDLNSGLQNVGKILVLEQGLKYQPTAFDAVQMEFIKSRQWQLEELARLVRMPLHMLGAVEGKGAQGSIEQQATEYLNLTLTSHTNRIGEKLDVTFGIEDELGLELDWDYTALTRADMTSRVAMWARAVAGGIATPNEARADLQLNPMEGGDHLWQPSNSQWAGSDKGGGLPDGGGRPEGSPNKTEVEK